MTARIARSSIGGLAVVLLVASAATAAPAPAQGSDDLAQQRFREGVEAARQERWVAAREAFEQAFALSKRPVVLINLAGAQARTGLLLEAARNYRRILEEGASAETAPFRKASAEVLPALEARIPRVRVRPSDLQEGDTIEIDGRNISADQLGAWQPLDPGTHDLVVRRAGVERARVAFSLAERESHDISLPVAVPRAPALAAAAPAIVSPAAPDGARARAPAHRAWWSSPWLWAAVAGVALASAGVVVFAGDPRADTYSGNVPPGSVSVR